MVIFLYSSLIIYVSVRLWLLLRYEIVNMKMWKDLDRQHVTKPIRSLLMNPLPPFPDRQLVEQWRRLYKADLKTKRIGSLVLAILPSCRIFTTHSLELALTVFFPMLHFQFGCKHSILFWNLLKLTTMNSLDTCFMNDCLLVCATK